MSDFQVRALEIHSLHAWNFEWVKKAIRFIKAHDMNTLVLHRNDFVDLIVYPSKYFGGKRDTYKNIFERYQDIYLSLYKHTPTRRSGPYQRRAYVKRVLEEARREGIEVYIENKELYFPDIIVEFFPQLLKDGKVCPSEPFWWEFMRTKYTEFFEEFPGIAGIITAPATSESRASISRNRCACDQCRNTTPQDWYKNLLTAMYEPIRAAGKKLIVRDFVFDSNAHHEIASTMEQLPEDVAMALKNTPHDFYPTFPENARIGQVGNREQWIEFDTMGQYFGWGISPAALVDDYRRRLKSAKQKGATGVIVRTDWESLDGHTSFDTPNLINVYALAALSNNLDADSTEMYRQWIEEQGWFAAGLSENGKKETTAWLESIMQETWEVTKRTNYVNDCVFSDSSLLPVSLDHALWLAEEKNSLKDWDPSKADALSAKEGNVRRIMAEKDDALKRACRLFAEIGKGNVGLTPECSTQLTDRFQNFVHYVSAFRIAVHAIILTKYLLERDEKADTEFARKGEELLREKLRQMEALAGEFEAWFGTTSFQHTVYALLDPERLIALRDDLARRVKI